MFIKYKVKSIKSVYKILMITITALILSTISIALSNYTSTLGLTDIELVRFNQLIVFILISTIIFISIKIADYKVIKTVYCFK